MKTASFGNFQVGIVNDPSVEDQGGFEFASGMDIFSEPGVCKACSQMVEANYAVEIPLAMPTEMVDTDDGTNTYGYIIAGAQIFQMTGIGFASQFHVNTQGDNVGVGVYNGYLYYASASKLGRTPVGTIVGVNDVYETLETDANYHTMVPQAGTLKIGNGRYIGSLDEAGVLTNQALKLPVGYRIITMAEYFSKLFAGTRRGTLNSITVHDSSVFDWRGIVLSSGSALPDTPYPMKMLGMRALISDSSRLYGFPDKTFGIHVFDGATFTEFRNLKRLGVLNVHHGSVTQHTDNSILFSGETGSQPGVYQMKNGAICQAFVPSTATPGSSELYDIGFVKSAFNGRVLIGYKNIDDNTYHIEFEHNARYPQNGAMIRTLWHRVGTDRFKRWTGVKLNLKPLADGCSVKVEYRTSRDAAFTDPGLSITSANQNKPALFTVRPRSREIQFRFTYTTNDANGPQLLSYDPIFETLNSTR